MWLMFPINFFAEIFIIRKQNSILGICLVKNIGIVHSARFFLYGEDFMRIGM